MENLERLCATGRLSLRRVALSGTIKIGPHLRRIKPFSVDKYLKFGEYDETILDFTKILEEKFSHCDLSAYYANIRKLQIVSKQLSEKDKQMFPNMPSAQKNNRIEVYTNQEDKTPKITRTHELLHLASRRKGIFKSFCGFHKRIAGIEIGVGINEGYTDLLNERYFHPNALVAARPALQLIASGIETIVGVEKMQQLYFTNDLEGLVREMTRYTSRENVITILLEADQIESPRMTKEKKEEIAKRIRIKLANIAMEKLKRQRSAEKITETAYREQVYAQELYVNGYSVHQQKNSANQETKYIIARGPSRRHSPTILSSGIYNGFVNGYFNHNGSKTEFSTELWRNPNGHTSGDIIEILREETLKVQADKRDQEAKSQALSTMLAPQPAAGQSSRLLKQGKP